MIEIVAGDFWHAEQNCIAVDDLTRVESRHQLRSSETWTEVDLPAVAWRPLAGQPVARGTMYLGYSGLLTGQHLAPGKPGTTTDRLVSFVDYAPTVLNLLGQPIPEAMQGEPFLGPNAAKPRRYVYGHRDRVDGDGTAAERRVVTPASTPSRFT